MANERITLEMDKKGVCLAMGGASPLSLRACIDIMLHGPQVDPTAFDGGFATLMFLDMWNIWDNDLAVLHHTICKGNVVLTIAVTRAYQLGLVARDLNEQIELAKMGKHTMDPEELLKLVKAELPDFYDGPALSTEVQA